jgi:hypothetical protein
MLAMQFAQSLLHRLFRDDLQSTWMSGAHSHCGDRIYEDYNCFMAVIAEVLL